MNSYSAKHHTIESTDGVQLRAILWKHMQSNNDLRSGPQGGSPCIVFVHQWSKMGGNAALMHGMAQRISAMGYNAVTFDMRGVRQSSGRSTLGGYAEIDDVVSVSRWASEHLGQKVVLVASSAGASTGGSALDRDDCIVGAVLIGYTFGFWASMIFGRHFKHILSSSKHKLFIIGTRDEFTGMGTYNKYYDRCREPKSKIVIEGGGHFEIEQPRYDQFMVEAVVNFINNENLHFRSDHMFDT
mmetsp:Transcript_4311/g.7659  ORF Transcript_4311/g.7659 Transcript_4311/m.7659 type:complete len:242 (-) Transcript_4311:274-999(-)